MKIRRLKSVTIMASCLALALFSMIQGAEDTSEQTGASWHVSTQITTTALNDEEIFKKEQVIGGKTEEQGERGAAETSDADWAAWRVLQRLIDDVR